MSNENLTNKELYDLKKEEKEKQYSSVNRRKTKRRFVMWAVVVLLLGGAVWGLVKLSPKTPESNGVVAVDAVSADDWVKGNKESKVILVEYGDFQCPACAAYHPLIKKLIDDNSSDFQFVYRHFPLQQHANAKPAAYASEAAGKQGKFGEMYDMIFSHQNDWATAKNGAEIFLEYARTLGLNLGQFKKDRDSGEVRDEVDRDYKGGVKANVNSTPTFYLNGKKIQPRSYEEFLNLIKEANASNS